MSGAEVELQSELYQQIGQLKVELDWLKKKLGCSAEVKRRLIEPGHLRLSITRQCQLLGARATRYYEPGGEGERNFRLMGLLDEQYTRTPFYVLRG